jgi:hypothetical protein
MINGQGGSTDRWFKSIMNLLGKKNGEIKPLATDNIFTITIGKCIKIMVTILVVDLLLRSQYAIGISGGYDMVVHSETNWVHHILHY